MDFRDQNLPKQLAQHFLVSVDDEDELNVYFKIRFSYIFLPLYSDNHISK